MLHKKSQWIFKNWQLLILVISVSQQFRQSKQGPFLSPSWYLGLSWLLWIGGEIIWGLICSNVWWLLLTEDLFFSMQASLRIFSLWSLWAFPDSLLMVPEWEGEHRKREPGRTIIPFMTRHLKAHDIHFILPNWGRQPQVPPKIKERGDKLCLWIRNSKFLEGHTGPEILSCHFGKR